MADCPLGDSMSQELWTRTLQASRISFVEATDFDAGVLLGLSVAGELP